MKDNLCVTQATLSILLYPISEQSCQISAASTVYTVAQLSVGTFDVCVAQKEIRMREVREYN